MNSTMPQHPSPEQNGKNQTPRRGWLSQSLGIFIALLSAAVPVGGSFAFLFAPLYKKKEETTDDGFLLVTTLDRLPRNGSVMQFPVMKDVVDAWNKFPNTPVGSIFIRKKEDGNLQAFNAKCPHLGCFIQYEAAQKGFACHCHGAGFKLTGEKVTATEDGKSVDNVSPRGMDELLVEVRNSNEVWVKYQNFRSGIKEKTPTA